MPREGVEELVEGDVHLLLRHGIELRPCGRGGRGDGGVIDGFVGPSADHAGEGGPGGEAPSLGQPGAGMDARLQAGGVVAQGDGDADVPRDDFVEGDLDIEQARRQVDGIGDALGDLHGGRCRRNQVLEAEVGDGAGGGAFWGLLLLRRVPSKCVFQPASLRLRAGIRPDRDARSANCPPGGGGSGCASVPLGQHREEQPDEQEKRDDQFGSHDLDFCIVFANIKQKDSNPIGLR